MSKRFIALVGPPNAGKTTLFNQLTGQNIKTVNYPGSTVNLMAGSSPKIKNMMFIDTPGLYSLTPQSDDEKITLESLTNLTVATSSQNKAPDLVLCVIDYAQMARHLLPVLQLTQQGFPVVVVLNHIKCPVDNLLCNQLEQQLKTPVISGDILTPDFNQQLLSFLNTYSFSDYQSLSTPPNSASTLYPHIETLLSRINYQPIQKKKWDWDFIFLHSFFGPFAFILVMSLFFYSLFALSGP